ncbi:MAG: hypothetical protein A2064_01445, partial [Spirochaetes bacterium GWB1_66_5]
MLPRADQTPEMVRFNVENVLLGETERVRIIKRKYAYARGNEYDHLKTDWSGRSADQYETISPKVLVPAGFDAPGNVPSVAGRRPTAPSRLCKTIVERFTGLVFSEQRRPRVMVEGDSDTEALLLAAVDQARFWSRCREARTLGGGCGAVAVSAHLRNGRFEVDVHPSFQCVPRWKDRRIFELRALIRSYEYVEEEDEIDSKTRRPTGRRVNRSYLYRRYMDEAIDVVFKPWPMDAGPPLWDEGQVAEGVEHKLGVCPAVWVPNLPNSDHFDGDADCDGAFQTFDAVDRLTAQINKALLVNLDPTAVITVDEAFLEQLGSTLAKGSDNAVKLPKGSTFDYKEIGGAGIMAGFELAKMLKQQALDACRAILVDPEKISGAAQSAKAIEYVFAPMLEKADDLRSQYGEGMVVPLLDRFIRLVNLVLGAGVAEAREVDPAVIDLPPRVIDGVPQRHRVGTGGRVSLKWGPYFSATSSDQQADVASAVQAKMGGLVDAEHAAQKIAPHFGVVDVGGMLEKIAGEREAEMGMLPGAPEFEFGPDGEPLPPEDGGAPPQGGPPQGG